MDAKIEVWQATTPEVKIFNPDYFCPVEVGKWYFGTIDVCRPYGPFDTRELAEEALLTYITTGGDK